VQWWWRVHNEGEGRDDPDFSFFFSQLPHLRSYEDLLLLGRLQRLAALALCLMGMHGQIGTPLGSTYT
jgi:hypothetical protein